jgi:hypothetical protein
MTSNEAWDLVKAGQIIWQWRRWVTVDGREFHWSDIDSRRDALLDAAKHVAKK